METEATLQGRALPTADEWQPYGLRLGETNG
jgi:hypothetical protein